MKIVFATGNKNKLREASEILGSYFELVTPSRLGVTEEIPETGETLAENSLQKVNYIREHCNDIECFADDTGLEVEILGGLPGVRTARYAGESKSFEANMDKLLEDMAIMEHEASMIRSFGFKTPRVSRKACFKTVVTLYYGGEIHVFEGRLDGKIALSKSGNGGFGYDPIFIADEFPDRTLAEISEENKNAISHRGKAFRAMAEFLKAQVEKSE